jgi:hypothetical protein
MRLGAGTAQHMGFHFVFSPETRRKRMAPHYQLTPREYKYCKDHKLAYETLKHLSKITRVGDMMVSFDLADGYYTLGIQKGQRLLYGKLSRLYKLPGLPMGWKCITHYFCRLTEVFIRHLREPLPNPTGHTPRIAQTITPYDRNRPDAISETRDGGEPAYSCKWTTS